MRLFISPTHQMLERDFFFFKTYAYKDRRMKVNIKAIKVFNLESGWKTGHWITRSRKTES